MKRNGKKKIKNQKLKIFVVVVFLAVITCIMLLVQVFELIGKRSNIKNENDVSQKRITNENNEEKKDLIINNFVDREYTISELENLTSDEVNELLNIQKRLIKQDDIDIKRIAGSADDFNSAKKLVSDAFTNENNFINKVSLIKEYEMYYVINVKWKYIDEDITNNYEQNVLVFKNFYYNKEKNILNIDDEEKIKQVLDIDYYIRNYNSSSKCLIQSFVNKQGRTCEYILYYLNVSYDRNNQKDKLDLVKEIVTMDPETGMIISQKEEAVKRNINVLDRD